MDYGQTAKPEKVGNNFDPFRLESDPALETNAGELVRDEEDVNTFTSNDTPADSAESELLQRMGNIATANQKSEESQAPKEIIPGVTPDITPSNQSNTEKNTKVESEEVPSSQNQNTESKNPVEIAETLEKEINNPDKYYEDFQKIRSEFEGDSKND